MSRTRLQGNMWFHRSTAEQADDEARLENPVGVIWTRAGLQGVQDLPSPVESDPVTDAERRTR